MRGLHQELGIVRGLHYQPAGHNTSRVMALRLRGCNPHYLDKIRGLREQLTMWAGLNDKDSVRIGHDAHAIIIEIPKPNTLWNEVTIESLQNFVRPGPIATFGLGLQDEPKRIDFTNEEMAHVFITGQTRSGKTNTQRLIAWDLIRNTPIEEIKLIIFDVAKLGYKWKDFGNVTGLLHPVIVEINTANKVLAWLSEEINRRAESECITPRIFVIVDELKALLDDSRVAKEYLPRIASVGGEFGLHLILSTQYSQISMLQSSELKRNVSTRLCGTVDDANAAANSLGIKNTGAEFLGGKGDFLFKNTDGLSRLTVAKLLPEHVEALPKSLLEQTIDLPDGDVTNGGPKAKRQPDALEASEVGFALFQPMGITKLAGTLKVGSSKASRIKAFAEALRKWAIEHGYQTIPVYTN